MELEIIMLSEISQSNKDKYHMFSLTCGSWGQIKQKYQSHESKRGTAGGVEEEGKIGSEEEGWERVIE
jgi:hypothetical protein